MNATGKRTRRMTGLNRSQAHRLNHTPKSQAKRRRSGWVGGKKR
jgi:hypothetical protein